MTEFIPLPARAQLPHSFGDLLVERQSDGTAIYTRILFTSGRPERITHEMAVRYATRYRGGMSPRLRALLYPPKLTIHHLMRERFELAMAYAEDGAFMTAAAKLIEMAEDYQARHYESEARIAQALREQS